LTGNSTHSFGGGAGGGTLNNCTLNGNSASLEGGGAAVATLNNCSVTSNSASTGGGASGGTLNNCTLIGNSASASGGGAAASAFFSSSVILNNCTLVGNSASQSGGGAYSGTLNSCIVYYNTATNGNHDSASTLNYCCTTPLPSTGAGNFTNAPLFVNTNGWSDLRLQATSPCINAGKNSFVSSATDLDDNSRIVGGTVDIGAYEYQSPSSCVSYAWLQQYGLPTDGSADFTDPEHDGMNNWQEWVAGTNPTNTASALRMLSATGTVSGVKVAWSSVTGRVYSVERATNLGASSAFSMLRSNVAGLAGTTTFTDSNSMGAAPRFYRVRVAQ
jgi:hypothetical protein